MNWTPEEASRLLQGRINQPHYIKWVIEKCCEREYLDGDVIVRNISSPRYGWHCTTKKKIELYKISSRIIAPVRFWPDRTTAERWAKRTGRELVIKIRLDHISYPLPDHKPAMFCPQDVVCFEV